MKKWKLIFRPFDDNIREALLQQHHAAQYIAMAGRYLVPQQPDDSNTNMEFLTDTGLLAGHELVKGIRLALHLTEMKLCILTSSGCTREISLAGKTKQEVYKEVKSMLAGTGVDTARMEYGLHYELPEHPLDKGTLFTHEDKQFFRENMLYRHNAQVILEEIIQVYDGAEPVRIWPHHFDTGTLIPLVHNKQGELTRSLGLGWAIPDTMVSEPYFYLSFWAKDAEVNLQHLPSPEQGKWMAPTWNGAVLPLAVILKSLEAEEQYNTVKEFYSTGIASLTSL